MESGGKGVDLEQWSRHAEWGEGRRSRTVESAWRVEGRA